MSPEEKAEKKYQLSLHHTAFLEEKTYWVAELDNGITVYQDDNRSGKKEPIAWKRLWDYCNREKVDIINMSIKFRSNTVIVPSSKTIDGYYFAYGARREMDENITRSYYICGVVIEDNLHYEWYSTPELLPFKKSERKYSEEDINSKKLILKKT